jgi:hypothetical protein
MAKFGNVHVNSQLISFFGATPLAITTAISATATTPITKLGGLQYLACEAIFVYGSGGTNATAYVQTSYDQGTTWVDMMAFQFLTATLSKIAAISSDVAFAVSTYAPATPTDGTLTVNTCVQGIFGDRLRLKYVTTGTYAGGTTLAVYAHAKG